MTNPKSQIPNLKLLRRRGFTLTELLVVMMVLAILAALTVAALAGAVNDARAARTRTVINKIDQLISERWEGYRTRAMPLPRVQNQNPAVVARSRLYVLREYMRMEMPDRRTDIVNYETNPPTLEINAVPGLVNCALQRGYFRLAVRATGGDPSNSATYTSLNSWTRQHESSECLYLILASTRDGHKSAIDYFSTDEIGDVDGDGMKEILDGWGQPIAFLRWAPGYAQQPGRDGGWGIAGTDDDGNGTVDDIFEAGWTLGAVPSDDTADSPVTPQTRIAVKHPQRTDIPFAPDPYDPLKTDPRWLDADLTTGPYALKPLIFSAGPDKSYDVATALEDSDASPPKEFRYSQTSTYVGGPRPPNDPYFVPPPGWTSSPYSPGTVGDMDGDGSPRGWVDNITNHDNTAPGS